MQTGGRSKKGVKIPQFWSNLTIADKLAIWGLALTLVFGAFGGWTGYRQLALARKNDSTSVSIDTFKSLLLKTDVLINQQRDELDYYKKELSELRALVEKTDTVIGVSNRQLILSERQQKIANQNYAATQIGEMNKLYGKARTVNSMTFKRVWTESGLKIPINASLLDSIRVLMLAEMGNSYLNSHTDLNRKWRDGYEAVDRLIFMLQQIEIGIPEDEKEVNRYKFSATTTVSGAAIAVMESIDKERLKMGLDYNFNAGDWAKVSHSMHKYPTVVYKVLKPGKEGFIFVRISKDSYPNMSDTLDSYYPWMVKVKKY